MPGLLNVMTTANPRVRSFVGIPMNADGRFDRARLETSVTFGFRIVRWHLEQPQATAV
jgi:hypothetical protein